MNIIINATNYLIILDKCSTVTVCAVSKEVCVNGVCGCGGSSTCQDNVLAPLCDGASCSGDIL